MERLINQRPPFENKIEELKKWVTGFEMGRVFITALELDVFSHLKTPLSSEALAGKLETRPDLTEKFLNLLRGMKLLDKKNGRFVTEPELAPFLVKDSPYFARYLQPQQHHFDNLIRLADILHGKTAAEPVDHEHRFNKTSIDWIARTCFFGRLQATIREIISLDEFQQARSLIDLGAGHGLFGIALAQENPNLCVTLYDKPDVLPTMEGCIGRYAPKGRVTAMAGDYMKENFGADYNIVFEACSFGGNTEKAAAFFQKVSSALSPGGLFIRMTCTLDDDEKGPLEPLLWDLKNALSKDKSHSRMTNTRLSRQLSECGLEIQKNIDMSPWCMSPTRLIISKKL